MELSLPTSTRGISGAFGLGGGGRTGPPGLDLSIPAQAIADVGRFACYGIAASRLPDQDGWALLSVSVVGGGIGLTTASLIVGPTAIPVLRPSDVVWINHAAVHLTASAAFADYDHCVVDLLYPSNANRLGPGNAGRIPIFVGEPNSVAATGALTAWAVSRGGWSVPVRPIPIHQGGEVRIALTQDAAAGTITADAHLLVRILPAGVPPV